MKLQNKSHKQQGMKMFIILMFSMLMACVFVRYISLKKEYPNPEVKTYSLGETVNLGNYNFTLKEWTWQDGSIVHQLLPEYHWIYLNGEEYPAEKERVGLATVVIEKIKQDETYLDLTNITFESGAWGNQSDQTILFGFNKELDSQLLDMQEGESQTIVFPITMADFHFTKSDWKNIDTRDFYIVLGYYPVKYQLLLSGN